LLRVEQLMANAAALVDRGEWVPTPPTAENHPQGRVLDDALRVAAQPGLDR
jgi:hypothetical protein